MTRMEICPPNSSQRAFMAAALVAASMKTKAAEVAAKRQWLAAARQAFLPGPKRPCVVCNKYAGLCHAHHVYPLALQFDDGVREPIQEHCWLCPTHHAAVHAHVDTDRRLSLQGIPLDENDKLLLLSVRFTDLRWSARPAA